MWARRCLELVKIGVVGLGAQAQNHLSVLAKDNRAQIVGVADVIPALRESTAKKYGCNPYASYKELLDSEKLDAVYVVTPNVYHYEALQYALSKHLNVFCEKPMVTQLRHAREIVDIVNDSKVVFQVGHNRRFAPVYKTLKQLVTSGRIKPYMVIMKLVTGELRRPAWGADPKISGGHLFDTPIHLFDLTRWLFGGISEVSCRGEANVYPTIENDFWINLYLESGLQVPVFTSGHASWITPFERVEVIGDHACAITEELNRISYTLALDAPTQTEEFYHLPQTVSWGVEEEDRLFLDSILQEKPPVVTVNDGFKTIEIIEALYQSARSGRPVKLPLKA